MSAYPVVFEQAQAQAQAQALTGICSTPLVVVTATAGDPRPGWPAAQEALAELSPTSDHRLVPATHASLLLDAADSASSVAAILDVVQAPRTGAAVPAR